MRGVFTAFVVVAGIPESAILTNVEIGTARRTFVTALDFDLHGQFVVAGPTNEFLLFRNHRLSSFRDITAIWMT